MLQQAIQFARTLPPAVWAIVALTGFGLARWIHLRQAVQLGPDETRAREALGDLYGALRRAAEAGDGRLPSSLADLTEVAGRSGQIDPSRWQYRPVEGGPLDPRLLVVCDAAAIRPMMQFPRLTRGRLILFWSGRVVLVPESAFERLITADDALREKLASAQTPAPRENHGQIDP